MNNGECRINQGLNITSCQLISWLESCRDKILVNAMFTCI